MTPTEQDKGLRAEVKQILKDGFDYYIGERKYTSSDMKPLDIYCTEHLMQLITADRKRVALEARIDELRLASDMQYMMRREDRVRYCSKRIVELKAQQEEFGDS